MKNPMTMQSVTKVNTPRILGDSVDNNLEVFGKHRKTESGRYVVTIVDSSKGITYFVRANSKMEAWVKLQMHQESQGFVITGTCVLHGKVLASKGDPQIAFWFEGQELG